MRRVVHPTADEQDLPGADLVSTGLADLSAGRESIEALLVAVASERLRELGRTVPDFGRGDPEARLYDPTHLTELFDGIEDGLYRFPTVDPDRLRWAVAALEGPRA